MNSTAPPVAQRIRRTPRAENQQPLRDVDWPWRDRFGRFSWLRMNVLIGSFFPALVVMFLFFTDDLGPEPWKLATREIGTHTMQFLLLSLAVTPLRWVADWQKVLQLRRMLGLVALSYALFHLVMYAGYQAWDLGTVVSEIVLRFYLTIGFLVLLGLVALGWTSTEGWQRKLGRRWKTLHRTVYVLAAFGIFHAFLQAKSRADQEVILAGCYLWLMFWRLLPGRFRASPPALLVMGVVSAVGAALIEWAWYAATTPLPATRILMANLNLDFQFGLDIRPAQIVLVLGIVVALIPLIRRGFGWLAGLRKRQPA